MNYYFNSLFHEFIQCAVSTNTIVMIFISNILIAILHKRALLVHTTMYSGTCFCVMAHPHAACLSTVGMQLRP